MKVVQIAIERGENIAGTPVTAIWALTDEGEIYTCTLGVWRKQTTPKKRPRKLK